MKQVLITGGTRGLGLSTAQELTRRGHAVWLTARSADAGRAAVGAVKAQVPGAIVDWLPLDLDSLDAVRAGAAEALRRVPRLDVLLLNAAALWAEGQADVLTKDGFEKQFGVNHLGHFLYTHALLPLLKKSAPARVVVVSSQLHLSGRGATKGIPATLDLARVREAAGDHTERYRSSKLANVLFTYALDRRLAPSGVRAGCMCPGFVPETGVSHARGFKKFLFGTVLKAMPFATTLKTATGHFADVCVDVPLDELGGKFFVAGKPVRSSEVSYDEAQQEALWARSLSWCGLTDG